MGNAKRMLRRIVGLALSVAMIIGILPAYRMKSYAATDARVSVNFTVCYDYAYEVLDYVNKERAKYGLSQLEMDEELMNMALQRCADSCVVGEAYDHSEINDEVAHHRANGDSCFSLSNKAGGENIAYGQKTPYSVMYNWSDDIDPYSSSDMDHSSWMRSDGHRKNILRSNWRSVGIACVYFNGKYRYYWAQEFSPYSAERKVTASGRVNMSMNVDVSADVYNRLIVRGVLDGSQINPDGSSGGNGGSGGDTSKVRGEWKSAGGRWWFQLDDGTYLQNSWLRSNDKWFAFDSEGYMMTGWNVVEGQYYYFQSNGQMASSEWVDGYWLSGDGTWSYRFYGSWHSDEYGWWYGDSSGWYAVSQWQKINGKWYYFDEWGYMVTNRNVGGYWLSADGSCI